MAVKFTEKAEKILLGAGNEAKERNHDFIGTEHVLFALLTQQDSIALQAISRCEIHVNDLRKSVLDTLDRITGKESPATIAFTPHAKRCLELAGDEAVRWGHFYITTEHLLMGLLREEEGCAARLLFDLGVTSQQIEERILAILGEPKEPQKEEKYQFLNAQNPKLAVLESFSIDLTAQAKMNKLDPVIGRAKEIQRIIQVLSRKTKNNPVVLGEPGVGKTAIIEGLAQRIADKEVPEVLANKRVISLDLAAVLAGTKYRGEFEKRLKTIIKEVIEVKNIVLFIDELHTIMGAGASESSLDASNILKPPLSRGEIQCIGATTLDEYRKHIEKDGAMERRFQTVIVDPPNSAETTEILAGLRDGFEAHHRVRITDEAISAAVELSSRYIPDRFLPDKAIDVLDEACSRERLAHTTKPPDIATIEDDLARLEREKDQAVHSQDFEVAAKFRDDVEKLKENRDQILLDWKNSAQEIDGKIDSEAVSETVALMTGIPVANLKEEETARLINMEQDLQEMVISQNPAVKVVCRAIRRARAGLKDPNRPMGSFVFVGPTGVGKTLLAKALAKFLFGSEEALLSLDMSEYMEKHSVSRLVGSPPGYVGYEEGGQLTEKVRRKPYSVILLDEIEKAHPDLTNMLLQILEEGRLTDSYGRAIDFKNCILIMTSNLGVSTSISQSRLGFRQNADDSERALQLAMITEELETHFRPEFLNRLDAIVTFDYLAGDAVRRIIDLELTKIHDRLATHNLSLSVSSEVLEKVIKDGYSEKSGARGLRRILEEVIEDPLSEMIILGQIQEGQTAQIDLETGKIGVRVLEEQDSPA
ncbi:MAG: ATP-dependent Clp protease ATP-binding subunit [Planctomycetes bacterium]|nr:ATP-dependent Clp protease ATP-binding subunit [Planctomycetota bacterium]